MTILSVASASVFGMYGNGDSWIDFLSHGNQFRARMDQLGFTLGNGTIKGTFGFKANTGFTGTILNAETGNEDKDNDFARLNATISAGIGYTSDAFGIGLGYNYTYINKGLGIHTPVLAINALNDNLRIAIPFQIATAKDFDKIVDPGVAHYQGTKDYLGLRTDIQMRYYTGIDAFNAVRLYVKYGQSGYSKDVAANKTQEYIGSSLGLELRLYFLNTTVGNASVNPYLKLAYKTALQGNNKDVQAHGLNTDTGNLVAAQKDYDGAKPYDFLIMPTLALSANSDVVSLLFEPSIGYTLASDPTTADPKKSVMSHKLAWGAYTELYFTPVKDLEWYFEIDVNNYDMNTAYKGKEAGSPVSFASSTGITWYLPSFGGDAQ